MFHFSQNRILAILTLIFTLPVLQPAVAATDLDRDMAHLGRTSQAFVSVVKKAKPAVVHIKVEKNSSQPSTIDQQLEDIFNNPLLEQFFGPYTKQFKQQQPRKRVQRGQGSGFIISRDGLILTNNHVVDQASKITVTLSDDRIFAARIIGTDPQTDVALVKIDDPEDLPVLPLGDSSQLQPGEWVIAIGNPFGLSQTVTAGVVSATGRSSIGINEYENFIQTDAAINPGNSGGPLINGRGEAVGINTALFSRTGGYMGIGFAIPINMAKSIEKQLQENGKVTRGWLGVVIQNMTKDLADSFGLSTTEGILVSEVQKDSPAEKAGIRPGDVIIQLDGVPLKNVASLRNKVAMMPPYRKANITLLRDGREQGTIVTIGEKPGTLASQPHKSSVTSENEQLLDKFGLTLQELSGRNSNRYSPGSGLLISNIAPGSPAERAGLQSGQLVESINRRDVGNFKELDKLMQSIKNSNKLLLRVRDGEYSTFIVLSANR